LTLGARAPAPACTRSRNLRGSLVGFDLFEESESAVYAIVRAGGRQEKVAVGDVLEIDRLDAEPGASVTLPVLLLVDGTDVTSDKKTLSGATVTVEVVGATKGPKIDILKYKNKTGYRRRSGHRQKHTQVKVTGIDSGSKK
jgi:large subunit ribosomal protein L21